MNFHFDEESHTYTVDGVVVPGVNRILEAGGLREDYGRVDPSLLALARQRGIYVHEACALLDQDDLDWSSVYAEWRPYVDAWAACCEKEHIVVSATEFPVYHPRGWCGTPDALGTYRGIPTIIDRKCTYKVGKHYGVQLAGYTCAGILRVEGHETTPGPEGVARLCVQLKKDGTYRLFPYDDAEDYDAFEDAFGAYEATTRCARWRNKYFRNGNA